MSRLALLGGPRVRNRPFPPYRPHGPEEREAVLRVLDSGCLSRYAGVDGPDFLGGPEVRALESEWAAACGVPMAVAMNSASSCLQAAIGAAGPGPGDEVIVTPLSITVSASAPLVFNAIPVFADVEPETLALSAGTIRARLTPRTRAVVIVHLFGIPVDMTPVMALAREHGLVVIEDCAQAPMARLPDGGLAGTRGDMGVFSLNYHKHIHTGEGGLVVTGNPVLGERLQMIRNHAEAVAGARGRGGWPNMIGFNLRMGEIEAAMGRSQLRKLLPLIQERQWRVRHLETALAGLPGIRPMRGQDGNGPVHYVHPLHVDPGTTGIPVALHVRALRAELSLDGQEGHVFRAGYVRPVHLEPLFRERTGYGGRGCPFLCPLYTGGTPEYGPGLCPVAERAGERLLLHDLIRPPMTRDDLDDVAAAFHKVHGALDELRRHGDRPAGD